MSKDFGKSRVITEGDTILCKFMMTQQDIIINLLGDTMVHHEFDDYGNHRLRCILEGQEYASNWVSYSHICNVDIPTADVRIYGCTDSWGGIFPNVFYCEDASSQFRDFGKEL